MALPTLQGHRIVFDATVVTNGDLTVGGVQDLFTADPNGIKKLRLAGIFLQENALAGVRIEIKFNGVVIWSGVASSSGGFPNPAIRPSALGEVVGSVGVVRITMTVIAGTPTLDGEIQLYLG